MLRCLYWPSVTGFKYQLLNGLKVSFDLDGKLKQMFAQQWDSFGLLNTVEKESINILQVIHFISYFSCGYFIKGLHRGQIV